MAATPFKVISWSPLEAITKDKLNAMVSNDNWLKQKMVQGTYGAHNITRDEGLRIASGLVLITARNSNSAAKSVTFNGYFSDGCKPIVTTGVISGHQRRIWVTLDGPGSLLHPTKDGFDVNVHVEAPNTNQITRNFYVSWMALGF